MNPTTRFLGVALAISLSAVIFLGSVIFLGFDESHINKKLNELEIGKNVPNYKFLNRNVLEFLNGKNGVLSPEFNDREKSHLEDVRRLFSMSKVLLLISIGIFCAVSVVFLKKLRNKNNRKIFFGKTLLHAGIATLAFSFAIYILMNFNFGSSFDVFHRIFFKEGTYLFNPETEMLTRLYPEEIFQNLAARISASILILSSAATIIGYYTLKSKAAKSS